MNISTLEALVEQENRWMAALGAQPLSLLSARDRQKVAELIDSRLSPENLSCDGELPASQVRARYKQLTRAAQELLSIDPTVTFYEYAE